MPSRLPAAHSTAHAPLLPTCSTPPQCSYKHQGELSFQDGVGGVVAEAAAAIPDGLLVFLPSYVLLDKLMARWKVGGMGLVDAGTWQDREGEGHSLRDGSWTGTCKRRLCRSSLVEPAVVPLTRAGLDAVGAAVSLACWRVPPPFLALAGLGPAGAPVGAEAGGAGAAGRRPGRAEEDDAGGWRLAAALPMGSTRTRCLLPLFPAARPELIPVAWVLMSCI